MSEEVPARSSTNAFSRNRDKAPYPHAEAAERRTEDLWACRSCGRAWAYDEVGERAARYCCTGQSPCSAEGCGEISLRYNSRCSKHDAEHSAERWAKRERAPLNGHMIFSERLEKYFTDEGEAWDRAEELAADSIAERGEDREPTPDEIRAEIEDMHLLLCEPEQPPVFEIARHLEDWLPRDGEDCDAEHWLSGPALAAAEDAVNEALAKMPPLYMPTSKALDLSCFAGPNGPYHKAKP